MLRSDNTSQGKACVGPAILPHGGGGAEGSVACLEFRDRTIVEESPLFYTDFLSPESAESGTLDYAVRRSSRLHTSAGSRGAVVLRCLESSQLWKCC